VLLTRFGRKDYPTLAPSAEVALPTA